MIWIALFLVLWMAVSIPAALLLGALIREAEMEAKHK